MRCLRLFLTVVIPCLVLCSAPAPRCLALDTHRRVALVIGNSQYATAPLRNPVNDATDMATALRQVGFTVTLLTDADQQRMEEAVEALSRE